MVEANLEQYRHFVDETNRVEALGHTANDTGPDGYPTEEASTLQQGYDSMGQIQQDLARYVGEDNVDDLLHLHIMDTGGYPEAPNPPGTLMPSDYVSKQEQMSKARINDIENQIENLKNLGHNEHDVDADGYPTPQAQSLRDLYTEYDHLNAQLWGGEPEGGTYEVPPSRISPEFGGVDVSNAKPLEDFTWEENNKLSGLLDQLDSLQRHESDAMAEIQDQPASDLINFFSQNPKLQAIIEHMARVEGEIVKMTGPERFNEAVNRHPGIAQREAQEKWFQSLKQPGAMNPTLNPQGLQELENLINVPEPQQATAGQPNTSGLMQQIFDAMREGRPTIRVGRSTYFIHEHPQGIELTQQQTPRPAPVSGPGARRPGITFPDIFPEGTSKP